MDYEVTIRAEGEVRNAAGELVERIPIEQTHTITAETARALGLIEGDKS